MANYQIDWAALLAAAENDYEGLNGLAEAILDAIDVNRGAVAPQGTLDRSRQMMVQHVVQGSPGSTIAREVAGLGAEARSHFVRSSQQLALAIVSLRAGRNCMTLARDKVKIAHDRVMGI